jgi:hypothetical protein
MAYHTTYAALCSPGFTRGACRRKLVNFIYKPIYGGTGIKASQYFESDPRVAQQPVLAALDYYQAAPHTYLNSSQLSTPFL